MFYGRTKNGERRDGALSAKPSGLSASPRGHRFLLEKAVRKLLVASQKSGVGKTTTSMNLAATAAASGARVLLLDADPLSTITAALNLAEQPRRQSLRQAGFDLPGVLVSDFVPGLDILSPYEDGRCSDGDLDELLRLITAPACQEGYSCLIVETPPFLGANPTQLLSVCDEFVVVMQAEAMAYRTLPAFLELVQRSRGENQKVPMRGILLTLPQGEMPGGRWERELRGRLGNRILPHVVPYDEAVEKALQAHQIVSTVEPEAHAAGAYRSLVASLGLAAERQPKAERAESPLLAAAAMFVPAGVGAKDSSYGLDLSETPVNDTSAEFEAVPEFRPTEEPAWRAEPSADGESPSDEGGSDRHPVGEDGDTLPPRRLLPEPKRSALGRPSGPSCKTALSEASLSAYREADAEPTAKTGTPRQPAAQSSLSMALIWVGLAAVAGVGLRFIELPDFMLPLVVGVAVTAAVVLALHLLAAGAGKGKKPAPARVAPQPDEANRFSAPDVTCPSSKIDANPANRRPSRPWSRPQG
jgi:chromosome partitioning protein